MYNIRQILCHSIHTIQSQGSVYTDGQEKKQTKWHTENPPGSGLKA